jgi:hypothetical protein
MDQQHLMNPVHVILPACTYPAPNASNDRQENLLENIRHIQRHFTGTSIVVVDNGSKAPSVPEGIQCIYCPELVTKNASLGEAELLIAGLSTVPDQAMVLKLHARCPLDNMGRMYRSRSLSSGFLLLTRNVFSWRNSGLDRLPYIDTRVFYLPAGVARSLLICARDALRQGNINLEQAMLLAVYQNPAFSPYVVTSGCFFPIFSGMAGHGKNYSSPASRIRSRVKAALYRLGL